MSQKNIYTIGHSTRTIEEFIALLQSFEIDIVVDIRKVPKSRYNPQFEENNLKRSLKAADIDYYHLSLLGGLRHSEKNSQNTAWKNSSFRGFADYMQTAAYEKGIEELLAYAVGKKVAIMCAEALFWRCHRALIADSLLARKITVRHILDKSSYKEHQITPWAKIEGKRVTYPSY